MFSNAMLDIRKEHELLQNKFSIDILYIRTKNDIRCKCFNMLHQIGDSNCHICFGKGYPTTLEKTRAITHITKIQNSNNYALKTPLSMTDPTLLTFYMEYNRMPKLGDIIAIVGWNKSGEPQDVKKVCVVTSVDEIRGDKGRVELYSCNAIVRSELNKLVQETINMLDNTAKSNIARGRRYIWPLQK